MGEGLISVVIPTCNYGRFVPGAVESVLGQTYPHREVIVVDDGSTDDTRERLARFQGRIQYILQENKGPSVARNTGIQAARGDYIAFLDSDDLWHPEKLAIQIRQFELSPELKLLATDHRVFDGSEVGRIDWAEVNCADGIRTRPVTFDELVVGARFGPSGVLARRACFDEVGLFDDGLRGTEDLDMWIRIAQRFPVAKLELPLWLYRVHGTNAHCATARMERNILKLIEQVFYGPAALSHSARLRRKALANVAINVAFGYRDHHSYVKALTRIGRSFLMWPFAYDDPEMAHLHPLARMRFLAIVLVQAVRWHSGLEQERPSHHIEAATPVVGAESLP